MLNIENLLIGSGISSLTYFNSTKRKISVISNSEFKIVKNKNFYEYDSIGGNTNIWGGYINYKRHNEFLKFKYYKDFIKKKIFFIEKIFDDNSEFKNTRCIVDRNHEILRINKNSFNNKIKNYRVDKILIKKNYLELFTNKKNIITKKLTLCIGNLNLIKLLYNSELITDTDLISFDDGRCTYVINFLIDQTNNYYIPMPLKNIFEKLYLKKSESYQMLKSSIILQKFSKSYKKYNVECSDLLKLNDKKIRFFLSNHLTNLRINNTPIRNFIKKKTNKIDIFCSGTLKKYIPGPIVQDIIFDILKNK